MSMMRRWFIDNWKDIAIVGGGLLLSLGLRWIYIELNPLISRDASVYCQIAKIWSRTGDFTAAYSEHIGGTAPFYIYMLKIGVDLGVPVIAWGRCLDFVFSAAFVLAFYVLGRTIFDGRRDAAAICMLIAGLHPVIARLSMGLLREGPFLMFAAFAMVCFVRAFKTGNLVSSFFCGVCLGSAMMLRHEGVEMVLLAALALLPWHGPRNIKCVLRGCRPSALMALGAAVAILLVMAVCGIPVKYMTHQYFSRFDKVGVQKK